MSISAPKEYHIRRIARIVIEFTTPFHVGSGQNGYGSDALVVADANGLPAIPGSSIAGVLRAAIESHSQKPLPSKKLADDLFGYQDKNDGRGSRLSLSWAVIHDSDNRPVDPLHDADQLQKDCILSNAMALQIRDHVRITHRGAADTEGHGKFDEQVIAAGHRFTFEMELVDKEPADDWQLLLDCLNSGTLRLGGKSRRGFGAFKIVELHTWVYDLENEEQFQKYSEHPQSLSVTVTKDEAPKQKTESSALFSPPVTITLRIQPRGFWMFGGSDDVSGKQGEEAKMVPVTGQRIQWNNNKASVVDGFVIPGTGWKGAIAHRVAFHYNRLGSNPKFADKMVADNNNNEQVHLPSHSEIEEITGNKNKAVRELFGFVDDISKETTDSRAARKPSNAARGRFLPDDLFLIKEIIPQQLINHVSIDRFTGGAMDSALFNERPFWQGNFPDLKFLILEPDKISRETRQALKATLDDLVEGRLSLGAGAGRGLGFFEGKSATPEYPSPIHCSHGDEWFKQEKSSSKEDQHE
jgi:CRISPR/Cas system CSM-associated protein Csm3 (group 7 of RAMP superfamily)